MMVFDRQLKQKQRDRAALRSDAPHFDYLRDDIADRLADRLDDIKGHTFPRVLDLGAGAGAMLAHLARRPDVKSVVQLDSSAAALARAAQKHAEVCRQRPDLVIEQIQHDEEVLPFADASMDLIVSNLALHWTNDLPGVLIQARRILRPDGALVLAMFGEGTLMELRDSFTLTSMERRGGVAPRVSPFAGLPDVGQLLTRAGFQLTTVDSEQLPVRFADPFVLMHELQAMGEANAPRVHARAKLSRDDLFAAAAAYRAVFGLGRGAHSEAATIPEYVSPEDEHAHSVPATFTVIYGIGWAPAPTQQKPLPRGSAKYNMKDVVEGRQKVVEIEEMPGLQEDTDEPTEEPGKKQR